MTKLLIEVTNMDTLNREIYDFSACNDEKRNACMRAGKVVKWTPDPCKCAAVYVADGTKWHVFEQTEAMFRQRANIRNFLLTATTEELARESYLRKMRGDTFAVHCVSELIDELKEEHSHAGDKP